MKKNIENIGIIWDQYSWGGVDSYLAYLLNSKYFKDINITIFLNKNNKGFENLKRNLKNSNVNFHYYKNYLTYVGNNKIIKILRLILAPLIFFVSYLRFKILCNNRNFDIFLAQCGGYGNLREEMAALLAIDKKKIKRLSLVVHHACTLPPLFIGYFVKLINSLLSKKLTSLISVSQATKMTIFNKSNLLDNQILQDVIIHNGVPIAPKNKNLNKPVNEKKIFRVGIISRIEKYKGHEDLIIAITKLNKHYLKKFKFEIIGSGDENYLRYLTKLVERNELSSSIHFLGYVKKQINEIIENLDLVVSTTRTFEGFGLSIIEAINLNVPVITTNVGAIPEYLDKDKCEIIPPSSPEELANSLKNFIDKNNEWNNRAYVAKKYLDENLNSDLMGEKYIKHFENNLKL